MENHNHRNNYSRRSKYLWITNGQKIQKGRLRMAIFQWKLIDEDIAVREADYYVYRCNELGIPKEIRPFFRCDALSLGQSMTINMHYNGTYYKVLIEFRSQYKPGFTRLSWPDEFGELFRQFFDAGETLPLIRFERTGKNEYNVTLSPGIKTKSFRQFYEDGFEDWTEGQIGRLITKEEWKALLTDPNVFNEKSLYVVRALFEYSADHTAACSQLAKRYGGTSNTYNSPIRGLGNRVLKKLQIPMIHGRECDSTAWSVSMLGKHAEPNLFVWKLRPELAEAYAEVFVKGKNT